MAVITRDSQESEAQIRRWIDHGMVAVVALCAAWCDTCAEFRDTLDRLAQARPDIVFVWLDIEDDSAICGDIDIENFPTLAIYRGERLLHYGVSLPQEGTVGRLIAELAKRTENGASAPQAVLDLPQKLLPGTPSRVG
jgi:thioredoxin 1